MNFRSLNSGSLTAAVIAVVLLTANPVAAQAPDPQPVAGYTVPRTADGQPDFEGFWTNATYTPLQRRDGVAGEFYTAEEVAASEARAADRESAQTVPGTRSQSGHPRKQPAHLTHLRPAGRKNPSEDSRRRTHHGAA